MGRFVCLSSLDYLLLTLLEYNIHTHILTTYLLVVGRWPLVVGRWSLVVGRLSLRWFAFGARERVKQQRTNCSVGAAPFTRSSSIAQFRLFSVTKFPENVLRD